MSRVVLARHIQSSWADYATVVTVVIVDSAAGVDHFKRTEPTLSKYCNKYLGNDLQFYSFIFLRLSTFSYLYYIFIPRWNEYCIISSYITI